MLSPTIHASGRKSAMVNKIHLQYYSDMHVAKVTKPPALCGDLGCPIQVVGDESTEPARESPQEIIVYISNHTSTWRLQ